MTAKTAITGTVTYASAVTRGRNAIRSQQDTMWTLGDLAANVETKYAEKTIDKLAADISKGGRELAVGTLRNYRTVAETYPPADRTTANSFTIYEKLAKLDNRLALLAAGPDGSGRTWKVSEVRDYLKSPETPVAPPAGTGDGDSGDNGSDGDTGNDTVPEVSKIDAARANVARLEGELKAARAKLAKLEKAELASAAKADAAKADAAKADAAKADAAKATAPALHTGTPGISAHTADTYNPACPTCQKDRKSSVTPMAAPRRNRRRQAA